MNFITSYEPRNKFIKNLALSLSGNTLILFQYVAKHGKILFELLQNKEILDRSVFLVYGGTEVEEREEIRSLVEVEINAIIVASYGVYSTGINVKNLNNIIFASPSKSKIRVLQSIGRGLRLSNNKDFATLFDLSDDLSSKSFVNSTLEHYKERLLIYQAEGFQVSSYAVELQ